MAGMALIGVASIKSLINQLKNMYQVCNIYPSLVEPESFKIVFLLNIFF